MTSSPKNKSLIWIIVFLIFTNLAMLAYFVFFNGPEKKSRGREDFITSFLQNDMKFDTVQMKAYQNLKKDRMQKVKPLFDSMRMAKENFYNLLYSSDTNDSLLAARAALIGNNQADLDINMFRYLKAIRGLCSTGQRAGFDTSFKKVVNKMTGRGRKSKDEKK
jgi:Spy/CpxP family protein refolding chaperone